MIAKSVFLKKTYVRGELVKTEEKLGIRELDKDIFDAKWINEKGIRFIFKAGEFSMWDDKRGIKEVSTWKNL